MAPDGVSHFYQRPDGRRAPVPAFIKPPQVMGRNGQHPLQTVENRGRAGQVTGYVVEIHLIQGVLQEIIGSAPEIYLKKIWRMRFVLA